MTTRVFAFHPNLKNGSRVNAALAQVAQEEGVVVRDMYAMYGDFKIDVEAEKAILEDTDRIVLLFPIFWYQTPALLKQWWDDVLQYGWAYGSQGTALQGKEVLLVASFGASQDDYREEGRFHVTIPELLKPLVTIQYHTGLQFLAPVITTGSLNLSDQDLEKVKETFRAALKAD